MDFALSEERRMLRDTKARERDADAAFEHSSAIVASEHGHGLAVVGTVIALVVVPLLMEEWE